MYVRLDGRVESVFFHATMAHEPRVSYIKGRMVGKSRISLNCWWLPYLCWLVQNLTRTSLARSFKWLASTFSSLSLSSAPPIINYAASSEYNRRPEYTTIREVEVCRTMCVCVVSSSPSQLRCSSLWGRRVDVEEQWGISSRVGRGGCWSWNKAKGMWLE